MSVFRLETVLDEEKTTFYIHLVDEKETQAIGYSDDLKWAKRIKSALEWLQSMEDGKMSLPPIRPSRARKPVARKCAKKRY